MITNEHKKMELRPFADEIKEQLNEEDYKEYRDVLKSYSAKLITKSQTRARLNQLFKGHCNLLIGLNNLFNPQSINGDDDSESDDDDSDSDDDKTSFHVKFGKAIDFAEKMRSFDSFTQVVNQRLKSEVDLPDFYSRIESIIDKKPDLKAAFYEFYSDGVCDESDESPLIRIYPSYVLRPPADVKNIGTDGNVLNTVWACRRPIKNDGDPMSYKEGPTPMMEHENDMEDQMVCVDLMFHTLKSTAAVVQKYVDGLLIKEIGEEHYLKKPAHFRCIESLYGDYGLEMINMLRCNPERVSPVLLKRLNEKLDEMRSCYPRLKFVIDDNCL